ncbi:MAG TPA: thioredoxin domain-containing protein [Nakamurella sp.]
MASRRKNPSPHQSCSQASRRAQLAAEQQAAARAKKRNRIITAVAAGVVLLMIGVGVVLQVRSSSNEPPTASAADVTVREDSYRLSDVPDGKVTFVEFLDFECEACGAAFPAVEQLRAAYGDRVSFVVRYFPLDGHFNAHRAARAVEAAAQQDQFEAMYKKMYETQAEWGEQQVRWMTLFRRYAQDLGLDMTKWDADYASDATLARIQADIDDGKAMGVTSTPTFFVNGHRLEPKSYDDLTTALDQALDQQ